MNKNTDISERIDQLVKYLGLSPNSFAKKLNYKRSQAVYDMIHGKAKPSFDFFSRLYNSEFSELINIEYIFTGKGDIAKKHKKQDPEEDVKLVENRVLSSEEEEVVKSFVNLFTKLRTIEEEVQHLKDEFIETEKKKCPVKRKKP